MADEVKKIIIVSDGTGKTAHRLMDAVLAQYSPDEVDFTVERVYQQVRDTAMLDKIVEEVDDEYLVIFSIISEELSKYFKDRLADKFVFHLDVLEPMLTTMSKFLGVHPDYRPGILQIIDDRYYKKVDAIGYAVEHDDGRGSLVENADIVLLGLSRTCKTPISMYLACNFGVKVANIPIVPSAIMEKYLLAKLTPLKSGHIIGLTMHPDVLAHVREERLPFLARDAAGQADLQQYYDLREVRAEVKFCRDLYNRHDWPIIEVTRRAIEEIAQEVIDYVGAHPKP